VLFRSVCPRPIETHKLRRSSAARKKKERCAEWREGGLGWVQWLVMSIRLGWWLPLVIVFAVACGDDDAGSPDAGAGHGGTAGSGGTSGVGGTGVGGTGGGGTGGAPDAGPPDPGPPVMCGELSCEGRVLAGAVAFTACCTAAGTGVQGDPLEIAGRGPGLCGINLSASMGGASACVQVDQPGTLDPSCPTVTGAGGTMPGCCTDEGYCGAMESFLALGCGYLSGSRGARCGSGDAGIEDDGGL
jgi:hypothetical protein